MSWDGKMYDKYRIEHTDGTPLKGKKYFVLRLDSDDPVEAARVSAAMRAYKNEPRNCERFRNADEALAALERHCNSSGNGCIRCPVAGSSTEEVECKIAWLFALAEGAGSTTGDERNRNE